MKYFRRLVVKGKYLHEREVFIYPRQQIRVEKESDGNLHKVDKFGTSSTTNIAKNKLGANVITPFVTEDGRNKR